VSILMGLPPSPRDREHTLRVAIVLGSGPAMRAIEERYGVPVIDWYGMTEAGSGTYTRLGEERRPGSAGRPFADSAMHILREDGSEAAADEVGEVCFEASRIGFQGYVDDAEATQAAIDGRWFHTGDLGRFDADGYFYFVDRKKDVVRRAGENVSSIEVETVLREHPDVADVAVLGRPDPVLGERIVAFVVVAPGRKAPDRHALAAHGRAQLAEFKLPEEVYEIAELPRTATGKVQKFQLRAQLQEQ
jgi:acyl-coenzyme A synthetase/AMP-(fatty) acid ligase